MSNTNKTGQPETAEEKETPETEATKETPKAEEAEASSGSEKQNKGEYELQCPRCGHRFTGGKTCPRCGYNGYFPMNERQIKRIKWILYPILLVAAALVYYFCVYRNG